MWQTSTLHANTQCWKLSLMSVLFISHTRHTLTLDMHLFKVSKAISQQFPLLSLFPASFPVRVSCVATTQKIFIHCLVLLQISLENAHMCFGCLCVVAVAALLSHAYHFGSTHKSLSNVIGIAFSRTTHFTRLWRWTILGITNAYVLF